METNSIVAVIVIIVFLVLGLVAVFRYDKVRHTLEVFGFKIGITGSRQSEGKKAKRSLSKDRDEPRQGGKATIKVGRNVKNSKLRVKSSHESGVDVKQNVEDSDIDVQGG